jgi:hypothetical protein
MVDVVTCRGRGDDPAHQIDSGFRAHAAEYANDPVPIDAHDETPDRKDRTHSRMIAPSSSFAMGPAPWGREIFLL